MVSQGGFDTLGRQSYCVQLWHSLQPSLPSVPEGGIGMGRVAPIPPNLERAMGGTGSWLFQPYAVQASLGPCYSQWLLVF